MPKYRIKTPLAYKVYIIVLISVAFCALFIGTFNYYENKKMLSENIGSGLKKIAQTAALGINVDKLESIQSAQDSSYAITRSHLLEVKNYNEIDAPLYILKKADKKTASLLVTTEPGAMIGSKYRINPTLHRVFNVGRSAFSPIYVDKSGTWISAYAPIKDKEGKMIGVLELNHHVGYYVKRLRTRLIHISVLCFVGFLVGALLSVPLLKPIVNSINILRIAASEMEKGNYDFKISLNTSDEIGFLADAFEKMRVAIKDYTEKLKVAWMMEKKAHLESVKALSEAIAVREPYTKGHIERVSKYAELISKELGLAKEEIDTIKYGCILHDVGKIGVNVDIINKTSKLTPSEYEKIKKHPYMGVQIIRGVKFLEKAKDIILYHQERYDGLGYPRGLKGEEIPISARIVALADTYDAMSSDRPYRQRLKEPEIILKIKKESGKQFDPNVVDAFLKVKKELGPLA
ncbi:MAG: HD domain-containing protein [Candidatus Omnitrophica bacterium]|nr:HD domain-containing protein [Candidatus Omnitrophota bacterium]